MGNKRPDYWQNESGNNVSRSGFVLHFDQTGNKLRVHLRAQGQHLIDNLATNRINGLKVSEVPLQTADSVSSSVSSGEVADSLLNE